MTRKCIKCGESLVVNEKLALMECVSGKHIEVINTNVDQWWCQCPECGQIGSNYRSQERFTQKFDNGLPVIIKGNIIMEEKNPESITCKACGNVFIK